MNPFDYPRSEKEFRYLIGLELDVVSKAIEERVMNRVLANFKVEAARLVKEQYQTQVVDENIALVENLTKILAMMAKRTVQGA